MKGRGQSIRDCFLAKQKRMSNKKERPDRLRAKKKAHKLSKKHVEMIRSQKGKMSVRQIAKWFQKRTHYIYKVSPTMVHYILTERYHANKDDDKVSIYDLINNEEINEKNLTTSIRGM